MNQKVLYKVLIWGFLFLYLLVAAISFFHAIQFFNVGNPHWMSVTLALCFEIGLALSLAAVLLSDKNKKSILPWVLMVTLTTVQVIGNVYSTFKYIALSEEEYYIYLEKPLLFWVEGISQETVQVIISWIIGAILPIIALFMTDMVASNIKNVSDTKPSDDPVRDTIDDPVRDNNDNNTNTDNISLDSVMPETQISETVINDTEKEETSQEPVETVKPLDEIKKKIQKIFRRT